MPTGRNIIVIGASAGGVRALQHLVAGLPSDIPAAIFVVQHIWGGSQSYLPAILQRAGRVRVVEAENGAKLETGTIYVAPPDKHLFVEADRMMVLRGPRENRTRPAINPLFRSAAAAFGNRVIGVILTGTLDDGAAGLWAVKQAGGVSVVQSDAEHPDMPKAALENVSVDHHVPLAVIPTLLDQLAREEVARSGSSKVPRAVEIGNGGAKMNGASFELDEVGNRSLFSCPECNGALWELKEGILEYRCHVGHAYSPEVLQAAQAGNIEQSLWTALRALKESAALDERLAVRAAEHGLEKAAAAHRQNSQDKLVQVERLQEFLAVLRPGDAEAVVVE